MFYSIEPHVKCCHDRSPDAWIFFFTFETDKNNIQTYYNYNGGQPEPSSERDACRS